MAQRGSEKLRERLGAHCTFQAEELDRVIERLRKNDLKIVDWECKGQPQPDFFRGTLEVAADRLGPAVELLGRNLEQRVSIEIFPYGIPKPDLFRIRFQNVGFGP